MKLSPSALQKPLRFRKLELKNRIIRATVGAAPFDWELKFAQIGVGAIISGCVPVCAGSAPLPGMPAIYRDDAVRVWRERVRRIQAAGCRYLIRIGQDRSPHYALSKQEIDSAVGAFAAAAVRVREAGADGVEVDGSQGSLIAQFLGPGVRDRPEEYQGSLAHRARLVREIARAVRGAVGPDFHVQVRLGTTSPLGLMTAGGLQVAAWLEEDGVDAIHLAAEGNPPGPGADSSCAIAAGFLKEAVSIPVLCNGRFEATEHILSTLSDSSCDAVTLARPLDVQLPGVFLRPAA